MQNFMFSTPSFFQIQIKKIRIMFVYNKILFIIFEIL